MQVSIDGFALEVNLPKATAGVFMGSTTATPYTRLTVTNNLFTISGVYNSGSANDFYIPFGTYSTAIAVKGEGNAFPTVILTGNAILPNNLTPPAVMFDRAIYTAQANGLISGNTVYGDAHDLCAQYVAGGTLTVSGNSFLGKGGRDVKGAQVDFTEPSASGAVVFSGNTVEPFGPATASGSAHVRSLMIKNNYFNAPVSISGNLFTNVQEVAVLVGNSKNATICDNVFKAADGDASFVYLQIGNKAMTGGTGANYVPLQMNATVQGNLFRAPTIAGGRAIEFLNHNATGATFGTITVGGAGALANVFEAGLDRFVHLDDEVKADSRLSARLAYSACASTVMAPFSASIDATLNKFDVGTGAQLPTDMTLASLFAVENKIAHKVDNAALGFVRVKAVNVYVTQSSGSIQRGIDAATVGDIVNVSAGAFTENIALNKRVTIDGQGDGSNPIADTVVTAALANAPVIRVTASGASLTERLVVKDLRVTGATPSGNNGSGILLASAGSHYTFDNVASVGNGGYGVVINLGGGVVGDLLLTDCNISDNTGAGFKLASVDSIDGMVISGSHFDRNNFGFYTDPGTASNITGLRVTDSTFDGNINTGVRFFHVEG